MAGLYIHIPFCKQKCSYCDFHFSTSLKNKKDLIQALCSEISLRSSLMKTPIETVYFGGGTPSLLNYDDLKILFDSIYSNFDICKEAEITIECNPDDINEIKLSEYKKLGINRLSIGIQSFYDEDLCFFNRAHSAKEATKAILLSQDAGFENITVDLIYGFTKLTQKKWESNLKKIEKLKIPHLSAYTLTIEPKTTLNYLLKTKKINNMSDELVIQQFQFLIDYTSSIGFEQYEISNFAKQGFISKHNSNYWLGKEYLGIGPSAHSYIANKRFWNLSNNAIYIKSIQQNTPFYEEEWIDENMAYNEFVLTRLRTSWGINYNELITKFNVEIVNHFNSKSQILLERYLIIKTNTGFCLSKQGIFVTDSVISDLFI